MRNTVDYQKMYEEMERDIFAQGVAQGVAQGFAQGVAQGFTQGFTQGTRQVITAIYEARFGTVPPALQAAIDVMTDIATLRRWITLVVRATPDGIAAAVLPSRAARVPRSAKSRPRGKKSPR